MSDTQGTSPEDQTPEISSEPFAPDAVAEDASATAPEASAPVAEASVAETPAPAAEPSAPPASSSAPPATSATPVAPTAPAAWQPPARPPLPGAAPAYTPQPTQAYARPQGYAGQPAQPIPPQAYAGQPAQGAAFGARPADTQPTLPLGGQASVPVTGTTPAAPNKPSSAGKVVGLLVAAAIVGGAAGLGGTAIGFNLFAPTSTSPAAGPTTVTVNDTESVNQTTAIAAKVVPSVVTISATSTSGSGTGSGVVLSEDGYVVTNTHVVTLDGATGSATIRVTTADGRVFNADVVGTDPTYDLAVIKLRDASGLTPIEFADSSALNVGDATVAVGAPLGLASTVTTGIVSALNRSIEIASSAAPDTGDAEDDQNDGNDGNGEQEDGVPPFLFDFGQGNTPGQGSESIKIAVIQTDASINPGNSGGALVDSEGRLIGINVAIASAGQSSGQSGSIGVGFAIPSTVVQRITDELIENGTATHGLLGANVKSAAYVEGSSITGAYIDAVSDGGAAAAAGLRQGDVVTGFNGIPITDSVDLTAQVRAAAAGSDATVTYVRDGETRTVDVTLGELVP